MRTGPAAGTLAEARKPPKAPLARTRSGAEANSVRLRGQRVDADARCLRAPGIP